MEPGGACAAFMPTPLLDSIRMWIAPHQPTVLASSPYGVRILVACHSVILFQAQGAEELVEVDVGDDAFVQGPVPGTAAEVQEDALGRDA
jgi:hypothetical protein